MKHTVRTAAFALILAAIATVASLPTAVQAATVKPAPKPTVQPSASPDSHPVPNCPINDPNGCGIYN